MFNIKRRAPGTFESLIPVICLVILLIFCVDIFGDAVASGPNQITLMLAGAIAGIFALLQGCTWHELETGILKNINVSMQALLILIIIGGLIGAWILGGIVPTLVVWGLKLLSPTFFLFATCVICSIVSLATGSSWSTAGTVGLALIAIGHTMGINMGMTAGAIISGAYFGDKMSPLSETTNLAPAMAGTDLFTHVRHMIYTTGPSLVIALIGFLILGFTIDTSHFSSDKIIEVTNAINSKYDTSLYILIPPVLVIFMVVKRFPALPALVVGIFLGVLFAFLFQPQVVHEFSGIKDNYLLAAYKASFNSVATGFSLTTGVPEVDSLLSRGGMTSMLSTVWLVLAAMTFGGIMEASGMLNKLAEGVLKLAKGTGNLIAATIGTCGFMNLTASDQYLTLVITGRMYKEAYEKAELHPKNLSRALEDAGTLTSPLVPWNTCGAFMAGTLGVATLAYLPFCFLNLINPIVSVIYGYTGYTIDKLPPKEVKAIE